MKIIRTEYFITNGIEYPIITDVYDLLSKEHDGTITSCSNIVVSGHNLQIPALGDSYICLVSATDIQQVIEFIDIHKYTDDTFIASLPELEPGEYFPTIKIVEKEEDSIYCIPSPWIVKSSLTDLIFFLR